MLGLSLSRGLAVAVTAIGVGATSVGLVYASDSGAPASVPSAPLSAGVVRHYDSGAPGPAMSGIEAGEPVVPTSVQGAYKNMTPPINPDTARSISPGEGMLAVVARNAENDVVLATLKSGSTEVAYTSAPPAAIADGLLTLTSLSPDLGGRMTVGVVPDGVKAVTVYDRAGATREVPVVQNVYAFRTAEASTLTWRGPDGREVSQTVSVQP